MVDKRKFLDLEDTPITKEEVKEIPRYPSYVEELRTRMTETERRFEEKKKQIDEEIGRTKTRLEADFQRQLEQAKRELILPLLEVLDNLERALESSATDDPMRQGVELTANMFRSKLQALGVEPIAMLGEPFDPNLGQAIGVVGVGIKEQDGIVVEEYVRGYRMGDQLLRPAQVRVGEYREAVSG